MQPVDVLLSTRTTTEEWRPRLLTHPAVV